MGAVKRLTIELPQEQYEFLRKQAIAAKKTTVGLIRSLIHECRIRIPKETANQYRADPFYQRRGSFDGPSNLAEEHDRDLYGSRRS